MPRKKGWRRAEARREVLCGQLQGPDKAHSPEKAQSPEKVVMVIPEPDGSMGPVKKRQRLSLKAMKQRSGAAAPSQAVDTSNNASKASPEKESVKSESTTTGSSLSYTDSSTSTSTDTSSSCSKVDLRVPPVASLENLGNTCFMNSIMQVLRYTPGFLHNLALLYQDIQASEKIKRKNKSNEEELQSFAEDMNKRCCKVVKNVYKVYRDLSVLEEKYEEVASDDVMSMAIKPSKVLLSIRELNPMYEGHLQHDAQEFLRCFLCYFQDAEKEVQKFYNQLPHKFSPKINPIMQRFLTCSKTSQETKDKIVKIVNELSDTKDENSIDEADKVVAAEKVKLNLFPKSEMKTETAKSPRKVQDTPKVGDTAGVVDEVNEKVTHAEARTEPPRTKQDTTEAMFPEGQNEIDIKVTSLGETGENSEKELHDCTTKQQRQKTSARRGRRYKPYDKNKKEPEKKKGLSESMLANKRMGKRSQQKDERQLSIMEGFSKTYSSKRLGMRGAILKKSAEELFDEVKKSENKSIDSDSSEKGSGCDTVGKQSSTSLPEVQKSPSLEELSQSKKSDVENFSKSESDVDCKQGKVTAVNSYQDAFSAFLSALPDEDSDSVEMQSDSDNEDIVLKKMREKELRNSPRRSPRKVASEVLRTTPRKLEMSKLALTSKSECSIETVKHQLEFTDGNKIQSGINTETEINRSDNAAVSDSLKTIDTINEKSDSPENQSVNSPVTDIKSEVIMEQKADSPAVPMALVPVVKLENCDYILTENGTSVSAAYATRWLTPVKNSRRSSSSSSNYLKQRNQLFSMDISDDEDFKKALAEMFNSPVKSRSKYDLIERTFQGTMMLRTRCLQCESSRERQEDFHDISVPVRIEKCDSDMEDEDDGSESKCDLLDLIEASTEVEKLLEENKYFCDECKAYVEAERSIHYDVMPDILTLHLKRFSSETGNPSNITKINDHVDIPLSLPCLRYKCSQSCLRPDHRYRLYGIVTHSGVTLTSGHYLAYVRTLPSQPADNILGKQQTLLRRTDDTNISPKDTDMSENPSDKSVPATRRKMGVAPKLPARFDDNVITNTKVKVFGAAAPKKMKPDPVSTLLPIKRFDCEWFECDDETVRVFDEPDFMELLSEKSGSLLGTPYLLFYHKATMC